MSANKISTRDVLVRPLINEKSTQLKDKLNQYVFQVALKSTKEDIKLAVEKFFNVKVSAVRTSINHGKKKRVGQTMGQNPNWKRAVVTLQDGQAIDFFAQA